MYVCMYGFCIHAYIYIYIYMDLDGIYIYIYLVGLKNIRVRLLGWLLFTRYGNISVPNHQPAGIEDESRYPLVNVYSLRTGTSTCLMGNSAMNSNVNGIHSGDANGLLLNMAYSWVSPN